MGSGKKTKPVKSQEEDRNRFLVKSKSMLGQKIRRRASPVHALLSTQTGNEHAARKGETSLVKKLVVGVDAQKDSGALSWSDPRE
jgi:hypothetical protein